jgi:hypothetical protein
MIYIRRQLLFGRKRRIGLLRKDISLLRMGVDMKIRKQENKKWLENTKTDTKTRKLYSFLSYGNKGGKQKMRKGVIG